MSGLLLALRSTQPAVEVEDTIIGEFVRCQENSGICYFSRMCDTIERRIFQIRLLQVWFQI